MKKLFVLYSSTATLANLTPLGGTQSDPTFNPASWNLAVANLNTPATPTTGTDLIVNFIQNATPEQGGITQAGGYNYQIVRKSTWFTITYSTLTGTGFVVGETVTDGTSGATGVITAITPTSATTGILLLNTLAVGVFAAAHVITGGTSSSTGVIVTYVAPTNLYVIYATSQKPHPYRFTAPSYAYPNGQPLNINADYIDLNTALQAYVNGTGHTL